MDTANKDIQVALRVGGLKKLFPIKKGFFQRVVGHVRAVDGVSFEIDTGETVGLVGESGCGKTTTGRCIMQLIKPTEGTVEFRVDDQMRNLCDVDAAELKRIRRSIQMMFQDPFSSLNPRLSVREVIDEPLRIHGMGTRQEREDRVRELLGKVGLSSHHMNLYPYQFSGGQRQRIGIARALSLRPQMIVCDEPVSALDVSVQAQVLNLLEELQEEMGLTYLFIAHDLSVVEHISDRVMIMYLGQIVESAPASLIYREPLHPYTQALLSAIPEPDPLIQRQRVRLAGSVPDPSSPPAGCRFHTRCQYAEAKCRVEVPSLREFNDGERRRVACHLAGELDLKGYEDDSGDKVG